MAKARSLLAVKGLVCFGVPNCKAGYRDVSPLRMRWGELSRKTARWMAGQVQILRMVDMFFGILVGHTRNNPKDAEMRLLSIPSAEQCRGLAHLCGGWPTFTFFVKVGTARSALTAFP